MTSIKKQVETLLSYMTLDEKLAQLGSWWMYELQTAGQLDSSKLKNKLGNGIGQITRVAGASTLDPVAAAKAGNRIQKFLLEETRLKIPAILHEESCSGAMILGGTAYPQMIGLASTFQPELAEKMTAEIRRQLLAIGARQSLAPVLDVSRDPRWGRTEETFGEDPTLVSHFGMAYIRGLQSDDLANGVMATGKHFIGHSLSQGGQNCAPVHIGRQELYDTFLGPFQAAIRDAGLASIMNSYPELDGEVVATSRHILTDLLRNELGFDGLVVSDYEAVDMIHYFHNAAADKSTAGRLALTAGIDVELPTIVCYGDPLKSALEAGDLDLETVNTAVSRHLQKKFELGLFENPYANEGNVLEVFETPEQRELTKEIAQQSMVLLKNNGLLPFKKDIDSLAVIGPNAHQVRSMLGDYSYEATKELLIYQSPENSAFVNLDHDATAKHGIKVVTVLDGITKIAASSAEIVYAKGCDNLSSDKSGFTEAIEIAKETDAIVLVLGDISGLVPTSTTGETRDSADLKLPGVQEDLAKEILAIGKPVAVVLINGRPYAIPFLDEKADAILEAWIPGEEGGTAVAKTLFGDANPGGKLPVTFPRHVGQLPIFYNHKPSGMKSHWYGDYVNEKAAPLYPFGHGLSYTTFGYENLSVKQKQASGGESVEISLKITNTGNVLGDEVIQLYIRDEVASSPRPVKELKGYARVTLEPSTSKTVAFNLPVDQLAFYNSELDLILEPGRILVMVGSSSDDIRLTGEFEIIGKGSMPVKERVFVCPVDIR
ncbi:MAG: glycoside hydrolase family 3 N-terminal domain-containing protein [Anaerolineales bacterium]|nr:MAG: glycoside hydrolase family 3 N-terminal domain-containing protein [Anaerolineales bacterium]